ncbi:MAG: hypothetical protein QW279_10040 [Candidatus Jordarchaeaceae archaeon]
MVYISGWAKELIKRHYGACGLENSVLQLIEELPEYLSLKLGKNEEFCHQAKTTLTKHWPSSFISKIDIFPLNQWFCHTHSR